MEISDVFFVIFDVVTGIALAAGGFTAAGVVYVFNKGKYSPLVRPAILTALFGYGLAGFGVFFDVGRLEYRIRTFTRSICCG